MNVVKPIAVAAPVLSPRASAIVELNDRTRQIFRQIVEAYLETGEPVGSRTLS
ncbi:MAG: heat-inducible transcriptional repressor HrcA, partial [Proteobacteria bacterium]|nr:heat-inducible transcriptional repressor HrcA [Pseudomonadota bacterium]